MNTMSISNGTHTKMRRDVYLLFLQTLAAKAMELISCFLTERAILRIAIAKLILIKHNLTRENIRAILTNPFHDLRTKAF